MGWSMRGTPDETQPNKDNTSVIANFLRTQLSYRLSNVVLPSRHSVVTFNLKKEVTKKAKPTKECFDWYAEAAPPLRQYMCCVYLDPIFLLVKQFYSPDVA